jgi:sugar phosphate isomerase/epimerase
MSLHRVATVASLTGFQGLEIVAFASVVTKPAEETQRILAEHNLDLFSVHPNVSPIPWLRPFGRHVAAVRLAQRLANQAMVVLHMPGPNAHPDMISDFYSALDEAVAGGLQVAIENITLRGASCDTYVKQHLRPLVDLAASRQVGITLDTGHAAASGTDPSVALQVIGVPLLRNLHLSDVRTLGVLGKLPMLAGYLEQHERPGRGKLALGQLLATLVTSGYEGLVTVEVNPIYLKPWSSRLLVAELRAIVSTIKASAAMEPTDHQPHAALAN